jgi:hypothetical protein
MFLYKKSLLPNYEKQAFFFILIFKTPFLINPAEISFWR